MKELMPQSFSPILHRMPQPDTTGFDNSTEYDVAGGGFDFSDVSTQYAGPGQSANTTATYSNPGNPVTIPPSDDPISELRVKTSIALRSIHKNFLQDGEIVRISSKFGGPSSFLGIGGTIINKSRHKLTGTYTTMGPELTDFGIYDGKQRETFFAIDFYSSYKDRLLKLQDKLTTNGYPHKGELGGDLLAISTGLKDKDPKRYNNIYDVHSYSEDAVDQPYTSNKKQFANVIRGENITIQPITLRKINANQTFHFFYDYPKNRLRAATVEETRNRRTLGEMATPNTQISEVNSLVSEQMFATSNWYTKHKFDSTTPDLRKNNLIIWENQKWTADRSRKFNDFRWDIEDVDGTYISPESPRNTTAWSSTISTKFSTHPAISDYKKNNLEDKFGLGKHGAPGSDRGNPRVTNILHNKVENIISTIPNAVTASLKSDKQGRFRTYPVPFVKTAGSSNSQTYQFRGDRINIIDYKRANFPINSNLVYEKGSFNNPNLPGTDDLIEFYFSSIVLDGHNYCPAEVIVFRAVFDSITDNHKPTWNAVKYMGRGDPLYTYDGYERDVSFNFTVHIGSRDEMKSSWRKLNYLAGYTAPEYTKSGYIRAPLCRLNIGNLFKKMPGYISSLSYTFDNVNGTWETAHLEGDRYNISTAASIREESKPGVLQLPKTIQVACSFVPVGVYRPEKYGVFYPLYDDRNNSDDEIENGLIPKTMERVNWFNPFDNIPMAGRSNVAQQKQGPVKKKNKGGAANLPAPVINTTVSGDPDVIDALAIAPGEENFVSPQQNPAVQPP